MYCNKAERLVFILRSPPNKGLQPTPSSEIQSIRGTVLVAGTAVPAADGQRCLVQLSNQTPSEGESYGCPKPLEP
jgi:hypothetical protein